MWKPHQELHARLAAPTKPSHDLMMGMLRRLEEVTPRQPDDIALYTIDHLNKVRTDEALALSEHLVKQLGYLGVGNG